MSFEMKLFGSTNKIQNAINKVARGDRMSILNKYGRMGVQQLADATPKRSGRTAASWDYSIATTSRGSEIQFRNTHVNKGVNIAVIIQYGHGTGTGGYVQGVDYINPALVPVFEQLKSDLLRELTR